MKNKVATSKKERGGDTGRTSSQGRKLASGTDVSKKGSPKLDEQTKSPVSAKKK